MNAAHPATSPRLRRVLLLLGDRQWHTTRDIVRDADVCAVNSCIAELRAQGATIDCSVVSVGGARRFRYRLMSMPPEWSAIKVPALELRTLVATESKRRSRPDTAQ